MGPQTLPDTVARSFTDDYLLYLLARTSAAASDAFHAELQTEGIPVSTWRILASLYPNQKMNVGRLAEKCLLKQPTLTRTLDRLATSGLVERLHETKDRRGVKVRLTDQGATLANKLIHKAKIHEAKTMSGFSAQDRATFIRHLRRLLDRSKAASQQS